MKKTVLFIILFIFLPILLPAQEKLSGSAIIQKVTDIMNPEASYSKSKFTIITTTGQTRDLFYESWTKEHGKKNLIRYTAPRRIKGQSMLLMNNAEDIWNYDPRTGRVRKLATHAKKQKMQGSDFAYEDMGSGNAFIEDFTHTRLPDEEREDISCYVIELKVKEGKESGYSRLIIWAEKATFVPRFIDYYAEDDPGNHVKTLILSDIQNIDGIPTPMHMKMLNITDRTETTAEFLEITYNVTVDDALFTERGLKK